MPRVATLAPVDWSEDRLIPDAIRAWQAGQPLQVRRPEAIRPWQHVLEPLSGYLTLAERLWDVPALAGAYNFDPDSGAQTTVRELVGMARAAYRCGETRYSETPEGPHKARSWLWMPPKRARYWACDPPSICSRPLSRRWIGIAGTMKARMRGCCAGRISEA